MKNILVITMLIVFTSCKNSQENSNFTNNQSNFVISNNCVPVTPEIDVDLHSKVLVVPANMQEYNYFKEVISRYGYSAQQKEYGVRYSGKRRNNLVVTLLKPGKKVTAKYGIIQLKGHTSDMLDCFKRAEQSIVPGKTILVSGGCESLQDLCKYAEMGIPAFTVNYIGIGPQNDYLVLQMQSLLQDNSYRRTLEILKLNAPIVMSKYDYPMASN